MSRMIWHGQTLDEMTDQELLEAHRDIEQAREALALAQGGIMASRVYDDDVEELSEQIRARPGLSEQPALPRRKPNPWIGVFEGVH